jgi:hypothetical protein
MRKEMPSATNSGTRDIPLKYADKLSAVVNRAWEEGEFESGTMHWDSINLFSEFGAAAG